MIKNNKNTLNLFTSSFPFGKGESFLEVELTYLAKEFDRINIYPFYFNNVTTKRDVPDNIFVHNPVIPNNKTLRLLLFIKSILLFAPVYSFVKEFFKYKVFKSKNIFNNWIMSFINFSILTKSNQFKEIQIKQNEIFYFFWGLGWALSLTILKKHASNTYFLRLHGSDVYIERSNGYIPLRKELYENVQYFLPISRQIEQYLVKTYGVDNKRIIVSRLGTEFIGNNDKENQNNKIHIVSCSNIIPLKRLHLLVEILSKIEDKQIKWTHFGDGVLMQNIIEQCKEKLSNNIEVNFVGRRKNSEILGFYNNTHIDLFINLSKYEGVPVSIMEAMSFGIPVIATNAGATSELVNNNNGLLIPIDFDIEEISKELKNIRNNKWTEKRSIAQNYWKENYSAEKNYKLLLEILKNNS